MPAVGVESHPFVPIPGFDGRWNHSECAMGLLVHRSCPDEIETANGVAVTANPFDPPVRAAEDKVAEWRCGEYWVIRRRICGE